MEIGNMDVEGWFILVDVLFYVSEGEFEILIDMVMFIGVVWVVFGFDFFLFYLDDDEFFSVFISVLN